MHIRILFVVVAFLMLIGMFWAANRDGNSKLQRPQFANAVICFIALAELTRDVVLPVAFDIEHMIPFLWVVLVVWGIVGPVFHASEDQIDPDAKDLRKSAGRRD